MLRKDGWLVNHKRVERIWRQEGLKVPARQPKRSHLWLNDGSIVRLRSEFPKHIWCYDFIKDRTHNGVPFRLLNVIDEYTRECLTAKVARRLTHKDVLEVLLDLFIEPGSPWENGYIESFNGKMRDELLAREIFYSLMEAQVLIEMWRKHYNTIWPYSSLGYRPQFQRRSLTNPHKFRNSVYNNVSGIYFGGMS